MNLPFDAAPQFISTEPAYKAVSSERKVSIRAAQKTPLKRKETPDDADLFSTYIAPPEKMASDLSALMSSHKEIICQGKVGTKTYQSLLFKISQLLAGDFVYAYTWDAQWFSKMSGKYPLESVKFKDWDELRNRISDVLDYVAERQKYGYWYPTKRNGKAQRVSLSNFLASPMKSGNWWSPFLEISFGDCATPRMYRNSLGNLVCNVLDDILKDVWFGKDFSTMVKFYSGASDLQKWYSANKEKLMEANGGSSYHISSFMSLLDSVRNCNLETRCVGPKFIGPWSEKWCVFKDWMEKNFEVFL